MREARVGRAARNAGVSLSIAASRAILEMEQPGLPLSALVDPAGRPDVYALALELGGICLFSGPLDEELRRTAPHLIPLRREPEVLERMLSSCWGRSCLLLCESLADAERLRRHLKSLLRVEDERGRLLFFRYYDPRVLRVYLPSCTEHELRLVSGPVHRFFVESEESDAVLALGTQGGRLHEERLRLEDFA